MTKRIFQAVCLVAAMVLVLSTGVLLALFYDNYVGRAEQSLRTEAAFVAQGLNTGGEDYLLGLTDRSRRITLVDQDGTVRYDNTADAGQMENHLEREDAPLTSRIRPRETFHQRRIQGNLEGLKACS